MANEPKLQKLTASEFEHWRPAVAVLRMVQQHLVDADQSVRAIATYLRNGAIRAGAGQHAIEGASESPRGVVEIEKEKWGDHRTDLTGMNLWRFGMLSVYRGDDMLTYLDVRFEPVGVAAMMVAMAPSHPAPPVPPPSSNGGGGRPRAIWREPVLIELAGQMFDGDLKPKRLADLEDAAKEWLGKQGEYPSERLVRDVVRPLWLRFMQEGKNPKG